MEYLLMMATVCAMIVIFGLLFHQKVAGAVFTVIGMIIGSNTSS